VIYLWKEYDRKNLEEILIHFKPDIVIEAVVERHVFDPLMTREKEEHALKSGEKPDSR
jgi:hypothetical protein